MKRLYGDGIHDDYPAIQEMLDSHLSLIKLKKPKVKYLISKTLKIHSNQTLFLTKDTIISLMDGANCSMLENDDFNKLSTNVTICGGIWDMNHAHQDPNPYHFPGKDGLLVFDRYKKLNLPTMWDVFPDIYSGHCIRLCRINNLVFKDVTIRNPVVYGIHVGHLKDFVFKNICFDYFEGSPKLWNLDGLHISGSCFNGIITNLYGTCHDDMLALTVDMESEDIVGGIDNIVVKGIHGEHTHSAVRLLSRKTPITNIRISNITGSYYVYCVGLTKYKENSDYGVMENINISNIKASSCEGTADVTWHYPFIWLEKGLHVKNIVINNVHRSVSNIDVPLLQVDQNVILENAIFTDINQE